MDGISWDMSNIGKLWVASFIVAFIVGGIAWLLPLMRRIRTLFVWAWREYKWKRNYYERFYWKDKDR